MFSVPVLSGKDLVSLLDMKDVLEVVRSVYERKAEGKTTVFPMVFHEFNSGVADMDIKSGDIKDDIFGLKLVSWFAENPAKGLPALIGTILVCDSKTGAPLGIAEGSHITGMRTGAAAALGAQYLARPDASTLLMIGSGHISGFAVAAALIAMPQLTRVLVHRPRNCADSAAAATHLAEELVKEFGICLDGITVEGAPDLESATRISDVIFTATPARAPMILRDWVKAGTHISCIGADMPGKQEIDPAILADALVFTDDTNQCIGNGEVELAVKTGIISADHIRGELGQVIAKQISARTDDSQITVFDTTGMALLDIATAKIAFTRAAERELGACVTL